MSKAGLEGSQTSEEDFWVGPSLKGVTMFIVIFVTASNKKEARKIAQALIKNKLAACVNIVDKIKSLFWWQGKVDAADEVLLVIKSKRKNFRQITKLIKSIHSYQVPEIIALPIVEGHRPYLEWIDESLTF